MGETPSASSLSLSAPRGIYFGGDDQLRLTVLNALTGVTVRIAGRFLRVDGTVVPIVDRLVPATDRTASTRTFQVGVGWLLEAHAIVSVGAPQLGQTFAQFSIVRGQTGAFDDLSTLAAGYITATQRLAVNDRRVQPSTEGAGALRTITGTQPAAGAEILELVPTGARWQLLAFGADLVTGVAVANRLPSLVGDDGLSRLFSSQLQSAETASTNTANYWFAAINVLGGSVAGTQAGPLPPLYYMAAGYRLRTVTAGIQAADQWSTPKFLVREWIEGA